MCKDGTWFWADAVVTPLRDHGQVMGYAKVIRDLGKHKEAHDQLRLVAERERIAKELQAGTIKVLFTVGLHLQALAASSGEDAIKRGLQDCIGELDAAIHGLCTYVCGLDLATRQLEGEERL